MTQELEDMQETDSLTARNTQSDKQYAEPYNAVEKYWKEHFSYRKEWALEINVLKCLQNIIDLMTSIQSLQNEVMLFHYCLVLFSIIIINYLTWNASTALQIALDLFGNTVRTLHNK